MISYNNIKIKYNLTNNFIKNVELFQNNMFYKSNSWICEDIINKIPLIEIAYKFLNNYTKINNYYEYTKKTICYELFEAYCYYKNNIPINYKLARYLINCSGILGTYMYYDNKIIFRLIFLSIKDIITELDGDGFYIWLDIMCNNKK